MTMKNSMDVSEVFYIVVFGDTIVSERKNTFDKALNMAVEMSKRDNSRYYVMRLMGYAEPLPDAVVFRTEHEATLYGVEDSDAEDN